MVLTQGVALGCVVPALRANFLVGPKGHDNLAQGNALGPRRLANAHFFRFITTSMVPDPAVDLNSVGRVLPVTSKQARMVSPSIS